jgi:hypothetical protein
MMERNASLFHRLLRFAKKNRAGVVQKNYSIIILIIIIFIINNIFDIYRTCARLRCFRQNRPLWQHGS